MHKHFMFF